MYCTFTGTTGASCHHLGLPWRQSPQLGSRIRSTRDKEAFVPILAAFWSFSFGKGMVPCALQRLIRHHNDAGMLVSITLDSLLIYFLTSIYPVRPRKPRTEYSRLSPYLGFVAVKLSFVLSFHPLQLRISGMWSRLFLLLAFVPALVRSLAPTDEIQDAVRDKKSGTTR